MELMSATGVVHHGDDDEENDHDDDVDHNVDDSSVMVILPSSSSSSLAGVEQEQEEVEEEQEEEQEEEKEQFLSTQSEQEEIRDEMIELESRKSHHLMSERELKEQKLMVMSMEQTPTPVPQDRVVQRQEKDLNRQMVVTTNVTSSATASAVTAATTGQISPTGLLHQKQKLKTGGGSGAPSGGGRLVVGAGGHQHHHHHHRTESHTQRVKQFATDLQEQIQQRQESSASSTGSSTSSTPTTTTVSVTKVSSASGSGASSPRLSHHMHHHHHTTHQTGGQEETKKKKTDDLLASICTFGEEKIDNEVIDLCLLLHECIQMRKKYILYDPSTDLLNISLYPWELPDVKHYHNMTDLHHPPNAQKKKRHHQPPTPFDPFNEDIPDDSPLRTNEEFEMRKGIFYVYPASSSSTTTTGATQNASTTATTTSEHKGLGLFPPMVSFKEFYDDHKRISKIVYHAPTKSFCYNRLKTLELKNSLYKNINEALETQEQKQVPHRDFYNVRKVDTHIHLSASMTQKRLIKFIKRKLKECPDEVVIFRDGKELTLAQTFESLNLTAYDISVDTLDVHANKSILHRFDKFNLKYNPFGQSRLREIFLKTDNLIGGRYFAELCKETFQDLEDSRYQMAEPRVSIYGVNANEWDKLGDWILDNEMYSDHVRWLIQIPRLYYVHRGNNVIKTVQEMLDNVFRPLFEVTRDPKSHPKLHLFLKQVIGFDSVDDETKPEPRFHSRLPTPDQWNTVDNPPYAYYNYYFYANINALNQYRMSKGLNTFKYRPHCGEAGDPLHLVSSYLVADNISHGIELRKTPVLQYLYYLQQIGLAVSPLSNNSLFLDYSKNPLPQFLCRGLNVSISTDDPLMFHLCRDPLLEEYSIGAQVWRLSNTDLCEMARNSVLMCGWDRIYKSYWLGDNYYLPGILGNDIHKTNMPNIRVQYRYETLVDEHLFILKCVMLNDLSCVHKSERVMAKNGVITYDELMRLIRRKKPLFLRSSERVHNFGNIKTHKHYEILERNRGSVATTVAAIPTSTSGKPKAVNHRSTSTDTSEDCDSNTTVQGTTPWKSLAAFAVPLLGIVAFGVINKQ